MTRSYVKDGGVGAPRDKLLVVVHLSHNVIHLFHGIPATSNGHNSLHGIPVTSHGHNSLHGIPATSHGHNSLHGIPVTPHGHNSLHGIPVTPHGHNSLHGIPVTCSQLTSWFSIIHIHTSKCRAKSHSSITPEDTHMKFYWVLAWLYSIQSRCFHTYLAQLNNWSVCLW